MRSTIGFINVTTGRTGTTGISGVNQKHRHPCALGFVGHEGTQLEERPTMQVCPLFSMNRNPRPYPFQIFQGNRSICVFRFGNQLLADAMVGVFGKTPFLSRKPLEFALGRPCAFGLQFGPQAAMTIAHVTDVTGRVCLSIAVYGNINYTEVNPQHAFNINRLGFVHFARSREEKYPLVQSQIAFSLPSLEQFQLPFSTYKGYAKPPVHRPNRHALILQAPGQDAVIVGDTTSRSENAFGFTVKFVRISNFGNYPYHHLRRKVELFSYRLIALVMQVILSEGFCLPSRVVDELTSSIGLFQRMPKRICLLGSEEQFDLCIQFHFTNCSTDVLKHQGLKLLLMAVLDVSLDRFRADISRCANINAFRPQCCVFAQIMMAEAFELLFQLKESNPIEQTDSIIGGKFGRCAQKQIYMIGYNLDCQYLEPVLRGASRLEFFQACLNKANQNLLLISRYPYRMVVDQICVLWVEIGFTWHRPMLAKEGGFPHSPKRSGLRRKEL